ncbi:TonB-dependent receptor [Tamlana sp. s12]|uniref:TonB-dependent receptor plug domain-containing protein n=1 Tax=Tamlana sp. s12 TaxID=1630406 RepID=UPI000801853C|nr:TonB-dependent receptor [Tamlana sp. s12]OBQ55432.1 TonB-dependent receptor [Tamlana sp. s12]QQY83912.1 TonB-dependent receptor [Tamlana sp. s12]
MKKIFFKTLLFFVCFHGVAQNDSLVNRLGEVVIVSDRKLTNHSAGYKVETLNDSIIVNNLESFSALLRFNSPLYIKEYGAGGTSTASFRGTSASNTAVIWNGININSINNGQTGFNSLTVSLFDAIDIRSGGGSLEYGSGAIGGTIHLNDNLKFSNDEFVSNQFIASLGSYDTYNGLYKLKISNSKWTINAGLSYNQSENDYPLLGTDYKNTNGAYENLGFNVSGSFLLTKFSKLNFYSSNYFGERLFSGELPNPTSANDKYQDINYRNLLVYTFDNKRLSHEAKLAYLFQEYRYFDDKASETFNFGLSDRYLLNYNVSYRLPKWHATVSSYSEYESAFGKTDQITERNRKQFSQSFIYDQHINRILYFDAKIRKDFNSDYQVPFTYALGLKVKPLNHFFIRANGSKNYRVPTYNDLYWPGQGNLDLIPESALQSEVGVGYKNNQFSIDVGAFYIQAKDKIIWTPNGDANRPGVWVPINLSEVTNKGLEVVMSYKKNLNKHQLVLNANYNYTLAIDGATDLQVIFVPKNLFNGNLGYNYKRFSFFYQQLFNGKVYTTASNSEDFVIPHYFVANTGIDFKLLNTQNQQLKMGIKVNNVFNKYYVTQPRRPMPNRNFNFNINYIF